MGGLDWEDRSKAGGIEEDLHGDEEVRAGGRRTRNKGRPLTTLGLNRSNLLRPETCFSRILDPSSRPLQPDSNMKA